MYMLQLTIVSQSESSLNSGNYEYKVDDINIVDEFWDQISKILSQQLISASEGKQTLSICSWSAKCD